MRTISLKEFVGRIGSLFNLLILVNFSDVLFLDLLLSSSLLLSLFFSELIERFLSFYYTNFSMISCHFSRRVAIFWLVCCFEDVICLTTTI